MSQTPKEIMDEIRRRQKPMPPHIVKNASIQLIKQIMTDQEITPQDLDVGFNRSKLKTIEDFRVAFDKLCALTPSKEEACRRINMNQRLFMEYQQKCLQQYDPTIQQAVEHAGDIIRELTKYGCGAYDLNYVAEKIDRLNRRVEELSERK